MAAYRRVGRWSFICVRRPPSFGWTLRFCRWKHDDYTEYVMIAGPWDLRILEEKHGSSSS